MMKNIAAILTIFALLAGPAYAETAAASSVSAAAGPGARMEAAADRIIPGDKLNIRVFGDESLTAMWHGTSVGYNVDMQGNMSFPLLGEVRAAGLTVEELRAALEEGLSRFLVYPNVNVSLHQRDISQKVSILGQVAKPGVYEYRPEMTITQLISEAGDFTRIATSLSGMKYVADMSRVQVIRKTSGGERTLEVNVGDIMSGRSKDFALEQGDLIVVLQGNSANSISILGEVTKPGNYELTSGLTLVRLISDAQGFGRLADPKKVVITSSGGAGARVVDAQAILMGRAADLELKPGDVIFVPESAF